MSFYYLQPPKRGWEFQDCSGWRIMQAIWLGRFLAIGVLPRTR